MTFLYKTFKEYEQANFHYRIARSYRNGGARDFRGEMMVFTGQKRVISPNNI